MNILILINPATNYKRFFYQLSNVFEDMGHSIYYAADSKRTIYMNPLAAIDSSSDTFYFDEFFKNNYHSCDDSLYESTWGESLFSDIDRVITKNSNIKHTSEYWVKAKNSLDKFFEQIIVEKNIDFVLYENVSNSFEYSAYRIANKYDRKYMGLSSSRISGRYELHTSIIDREVELISNLRNTPIDSKELDWYELYQKNILNMQPDYMVDNATSKTKYKDIFNLNNLKKFAKAINAHGSYNHQYDYMNSSPLFSMLHGLQYSMKRNINVKALEQYYLTSEALKKAIEVDEFYIYPMHYHPESSTSVLAPSYTNEFNNILNISNNLPLGTYLYVKDHANAVGVQSTDFYKKIQLLPAVKLIHHKVNIKNLIIKSKGVITVNSTAGYEAQVLGKPVILLGRVFYESFKNVYKVNNFSEIYETIKTMSELNSKEVLKDIIAYYKYTYSGVLDFDKENYSEDYFADMAKNIIERYRIG